MSSLPLAHDLTQLFFDVQHTDNTDFVWVLTGAVDEQGNLLCLPSVLSYTTAAERGAFNITGTVAVAIATSKHIVCDLFGASLAVLRDAPEEEGGSIVAAGITDQEAEYTLRGIRPGTYWPYAFSDHRNPGIYGSSEHERAHYDPDFDESPNSITVTSTNLNEIHLFIEDTASSIHLDTEVPGRLTLSMNYPNPFSSQTTFSFHLERPMPITLTVHDLLGRKVATVAKGFYSAGTYKMTWEAGDLPSGLYGVRLEGGGSLSVRSILLVR